MDMCQQGRVDAPKYKPYVETARRLLDGLIMYRPELGEAGRQLELLLRCRGVSATTDHPCPERLQ